MIQKTMLHGCMNVVVRDKPRKKEGLDKIGLVGQDKDFGIYFKSNWHPGMCFK